MLWLVFLALWAQQPAATRWPIQSLAVEGNHNYTSAQVMAVAGLKIGQMAGKAEFEAARDRLVATGVFETVGYRFAPAQAKTGYAASFQVVEVEPVYPVRFEDLGASDRELADFIRSREPMFAPNVPATAPILERYAKTIQAYLAAGKREEKVVGKVTAIGPDKFVVLFRPARPIPAVAQVTFTGNQEVPLKTLQEAITGVAIGLPYTEPRFRELLDNSIRPLYDARGRIRVAFPKIAVAPTQDVQGLAVTVTVDEGGSYKLAGVAFEGAPNYARDALLKTAKIKTGDTVNFELVREGVEHVRKALRRDGYMHAETSLERQVNDAEKTVAILVHLKESPQYTFGRLSIEGLDLNGEAAVRKMWNIKPGKPFNADYPEFFLARVRDDGLFDNLNRARSAMNVNDQDRTVDVTLFFNK